MEFKDRFTTVKDNIIQSYQKLHPHLDESEASCLHSAKNIAFHAFKEYVREGRLDRLAEYRTELNLLQQELKGHVNDRMWETIKELNV